MDSTDSQSVMTFQGETSNRPAGSTSEARQHDVPNYRWARNGTSTDLESPPPSGWSSNGWGAAFIPSNHSLSRQFPATHGDCLKLVPLNSNRKPRANP